MGIIGDTWYVVGYSSTAVPVGVRITTLTHLLQQYYTHTHTHTHTHTICVIMVPARCAQQLNTDVPMVAAGREAGGWWLSRAVFVAWCLQYRITWGRKSNSKELPGWVHISKVTYSRQSEALYLVLWPRERAIRLTYQICLTICRSMFHGKLVQFDLFFSKALWKQVTYAIVKMCCSCRRVLMSVLLLLS